MPVNSNKPERWKADVAQSVDFYNEWFMSFAPDTYRNTRLRTTEQVLEAFKLTENLTNIGPKVLKAHPSIVEILRMSTAPPIARDRLIGLSGVSSTVIRNMELNNRLPPSLDDADIDAALEKIGYVISRLLDRDIFTWSNKDKDASQDIVYRAATVIADRLCGAIANPIIRNAQEQRQLATIERWLNERGYNLLEASDRVAFDSIPAGSFTFRLNIPIQQKGRDQQVNIPIDAVVMPKNAQAGEKPLLIEAKSAGDFTNTNKRRKEEAVKVSQLRHTYGQDVHFVLFLCGYFDSGYLGYEAAEGIDWVWEHRLEDLAEFGL
ncbi:MAG: XamI family restriction endonuclease [Caldilineaceae bacterium]|nr:XamI family restriction endonuclease [Caldilineaceae bacterium]